MKTIFLFSDPIDLCDRLNLLLEEKQAGKHSYMIKDKIVALVDELIEYNCISTKKDKISPLKCSD